MGERERERERESDKCNDSRRDGQNEKGSAVEKLLRRQMYGHLISLEVQGGGGWPVSSGRGAQQHVHIGTHYGCHLLVYPRQLQPLLNATPSLLLAATLPPSSLTETSANSLLVQ